MQLYSKLKSASDQALRDKNKDQRAILSVVLDDAQKLAKAVQNAEPSDADCIKALRTSISHQTDLIQSLLDHKVSTTDERFFMPTETAKYLRSFLPKQLTDDQLYDTMTAFIKTHAHEGRRLIGLVMAHLKTCYEGQYEGAHAKLLFDEIMKEQTELESK